MRRYAVALCVANVNRIAIVDGITPVDAIIRGAASILGLDDASAWLANLRQSCPNAEAVQAEFSTGGMSISCPIPLQ